MSGAVVQQDGATCHTARATNDLLKDTFGDRLISRFVCELASKIFEIITARLFSVGLCKVIGHLPLISHKRLTIWKTTFAVLVPIYGHKCWKKSSKIGHPDWTTSE
ncbi:uncharacterized protein TNCV_4880721 [Trichonephila clavipes]|nr:uncharacterized protein TNCV_4880721 [Trichonephila clavipes]